MVSSTAEDIKHLRKGEIRLILTRKHSSLAFIVLEGSFHMTGGKRNQSKDLHSFDPVTNNMAVLARYDYLYNHATNIVGIINHFLIGLKAGSKRWSYV